LDPTARGVFGGFGGFVLAVSLYLAEFGSGVEKSQELASSIMAGVTVSAA
jgi:hypothetical protein